MVEKNKKTKQKTGGKVTPKSRKRTVKLLALASVITIPAMLMIGFVVTYAFTTVPNPKDIVLNQMASVSYSDGSNMINIIPPEGNRTLVKIQDVPDNVKSAIIAAEDRSFETNPGFSIKGLLRAVKDNIFDSSEAGGGSTITQQYVKNALVGNQHSLKRKWKELVTATKMSKEWSKDEILEAYINTVYFGRNAYGIAAASRAYFGKSYKQLSTGEAAVLAAVLQAPSVLDPAINPKSAKDRWNYVLDGMVEIGKLSKQDRDKIEYPKTLSAKQFMSYDDARVKGPLGLIRTQVINELTKLGINSADLNTAGLKITTTIDKKVQNATNETVKQVLSGEPDKLKAATVSIDPKTGAIRGYYGGSDGLGFDLAQAGLQTGSSFKVFALIAALDQGIPLSKNYSSAPLTLGNITINNSDGESCGTCNIATATKMSLNTSFYRLMLDLKNGAQDVADYAHKAGIAESFGDIKHTLASANGGPPENGIVLGQYLSRVLDMASAYATLADSGIYHQPYLVQKVTTADGKVLYDKGNNQGTRRLKAAVADNVTSALEPIPAYSRGHNLAGGRPSAAKTGTSQLGDTGQNKDAWMVGYTPTLSTAVWVGTSDGSAITNSWGGIIYGSGLPADIWKGVMDQSLEGTPVDSFPNPEAIGGQAGVPVEVVKTEDKDKKKHKKKVEEDYDDDDDYDPGYGDDGEDRKQNDNQEIEIIPGIKIPNPFAPPPKVHRHG